LVVTNGGSVISTNGFIGFFASASNNTAIVSGSNSVWNILSSLVIGSNAANDALVITNGGQVFDAGANIGTDAGNNFNVSVLVTGTNSLWSNGGFVSVSADNPSTAVTIANGGRFSGGGIVQIGRSAARMAMWCW